MVVFFFVFRQITFPEKFLKVVSVEIRYVNVAQRYLKDLFALTWQLVLSAEVQVLLQALLRAQIFILLDEIVHLQILLFSWGEYNHLYCS
jgi:hypothetical protein